MASKISPLPSATAPVSGGSHEVDTTEATTRPCLSLHGNSTLSIITREHLVCTVCTDMVRVKPIYQCCNGHTICSECVWIVKACPVCRVGLANVRKVRNRAMEMLLDQVNVPCPYQNQGCVEVFPSSSLQKHISECYFSLFHLCPSLGFNDCDQMLNSKTWKIHIQETHDLHVQASRRENVAAVYANFLSTKTLKDASLLKWAPLVLAPFPYSGPFLIMSELDVLYDCTATFSVIYAPLKAAVSTDTSANANNDVNLYFVEITVAKPCCPCSSTSDQLPLEVTWTGKPMLYSEFKDGSNKGVFKVILSEFRAPNNDTLNTSNNPSASGAAALPPIPRIPPPQQPGNNPVAPSAPPRMAGSPPPGPRPRSRSVRQDLEVRIRITKSLQDLEEKPYPDRASFGHALIEKYTSVKSVAYRGTKCDHCKQGPIRGIRYKCMECPKFDLCYTCMNEKEVHTHHYFYYIRTTEQNSRMMKNFKYTYCEGPPPENEEQVVPESADEDGDQPSAHH